MKHHKTHSTRWLLPLLFFFLLLNLSKANAIILNAGGTGTNTTIDKKWQPPITLANTTLDIPGVTSIASQPHRQKSQPKIITNKNDKAFAVWMQYDSSIGGIDPSNLNSVDVKYSLWSSYFNGRHWSSPIKIKGHNPSEKTTVPEIIFDDNGDILATWTESTRMDRFRFTQPIVFANRFDTLNLDWENPAQLTFDVPNTYIYNLRIISRNNGVINTVWEEHKRNNDNSFYSTSLLSSTFNGSSWDNPTQLYESRTIEEYRTKDNITFNNYNSDIVSTYISNRTNQAFIRHFNGSNWSAPQQLSPDTTFYVTDLEAAFDQSGNVIAVWQDLQEKEQDYTYHIFASHFNRSNRSWSTPIPIEGTTGGGYPKLAVNHNGSAMAVWDGSSEEGESVLWANYFNGSNWGTPFLIDTAPWPSGKLSLSKVTFDQKNHAHVAWKKLINGKPHLLNKRFDGNRWSTTTSIGLNTSKSTRTPLKVVFESGNTQIAIGGDGNAHVLSENTLRTLEREGPDSSYPYKETLTKTIWTSQFKTVPPIRIQEAFVYMPFGGLAVLIGDGFTNFFTEEDLKQVKLVDQNGVAPLVIYHWKDDMIVALFRNIPDSVTMTTPNETKTIPLVKYY